MRTIGAMVVAAGLALAGPAGAEPRMVDRVAAVVNDDMIALSEVHERAAAELMMLEQEGQASTERRRAALKNALDDLIADRLLTAEEKALAIEVTDQEVEYAIDDVRKQNRMDPETFERALMAQGHSMSAYREKMRKDLAAMKLIGMKVRSKIKVSEEDIKAEYARMSRELETEFEVRARHIVIQVPKDADAVKERVGSARPTWPAAPAAARTSSSWPRSTAKAPRARTAATSASSSAGTWSAPSRRSPSAWSPARSATRCALRSAST